MQTTKIQNATQMTQADFQEAFKALEEIEQKAKTDREREWCELKWAELEALQEEFIGKVGA